jgi:Family of unknown function (DUF5681)
MDPAEPDGGRYERLQGRLRQAPEGEAVQARQIGKSKGPRPKGSLNLATDLTAELGEHITVREDGRSRKVSKQRALIKSLVAKALQGDVRATAALLALYARVITEVPEDQDGPIHTEELQILRRFAPRLLKSIVSK